MGNGSDEGESSHSHKVHIWGCERRLQLHRRASNISTVVSLGTVAAYVWKSPHRNTKLFFFCHVQCLHIVLHPGIPTLLTSRSVRGETACGSAWAASPACRPAGWRSACPSGRTPSRRRGSPERTAMSQCSAVKVTHAAAAAAAAASSLHECCKCSTNMFNSQTLPCRGWSLPALSLCPRRSPPARWWLPRAGWWLASPWPGAHTK